MEQLQAQCWHGYLSSVDLTAARGAGKCDQRKENRSRYRIHIPRVYSTWLLCNKQHAVDAGGLDKMPRNFAPVTGVKIFELG